MQLSAEIRWFWKGENRQLTEWFCGAVVHDFAAGGGGVTARIDNYLIDPDQSELGIKQRGKKPGIEVKGLVSKDAAQINEGPFAGNIEVWSKWATMGLKLEDKNTLIAIAKRRWVRKFSTETEPSREVQLGEDEMPVSEALPKRGCNVELTRIETPDGRDWWTFGFESFGSLSTVETDLQTIAGLLAERGVPTFNKEKSCGYPAWIQSLRRP